MTNWTSFLRGNRSRHHYMGLTMWRRIIWPYEQYHKPQFASFSSNTPDVTYGTGSANPFGTPQYTPIVSGIHIARSFVFCVCIVGRCLSFSFCSCMTRVTSRTIVLECMIESMTRKKRKDYFLNFTAFTVPSINCYFGSIFCFLCMFCRSLSVLFLFILAIVLFFFLRFTASDYLFGIFKLYLWKPVFGGGSFMEWGRTMYDPCDISHYSVGMYDWINDEEKTKGLFSKFYSIYGSFYK
jgi:hypothetical protein